MAEAGLDPLVEQEAETLALREAAERVALGEGRLVVIEGRRASARPASCARSARRPTSVTTSACYRRGGDRYSRDQRPVLAGQHAHAERLCAWPSTTSSGLTSPRSSSLAFLARRRRLPLLVAVATRSVREAPSPAGGARDRAGRNGAAAGATQRGVGRGTRARDGGSRRRRGLRRGLPRGHPRQPVPAFRAPARGAGTAHPPRRRRPRAAWARSHREWSRQPSSSVWAACLREPGPGRGDRRARRWHTARLGGPARRSRP